MAKLEESTCKRIQAIVESISEHDSNTGQLHTLYALMEEVFSSDWYKDKYLSMYAMSCMMTKTFKTTREKYDNS